MLGHPLMDYSIYTIHMLQHARSRFKADWCNKFEGGGGDFTSQ